MRTTSDLQASGPAPTVSFDPFGEPLELSRAESGRVEGCRAEPPRERKAYRITAAAFDARFASAKVWPSLAALTAARWSNGIK